LQQFLDRTADLKKKAIDWSIFGRTKLFKTLDRYRELTGRLRENSSMITAIMLVEGRVLLQDEQSQLAARNMKHQEAYKRQARAVSCEPPADLGPIDGVVKAGKPFTPLQCQTVMAKLATSNDEWEDAEDVVAEVRYFEPDSLDYSHSLQRDLVRRLTYLLESSSFTAALSEISGQSDVTLLSLKFRGYVNLEDRKGVVFVYDLPRIAPQPGSGGITTLYDLVNRSSAPGGSIPSLANRLLIAHTLASTVQNVHCSLWVHKNIWSKGVVMTDSPNTKHRLREAFAVPYLAGWGIARPSDANTNKIANHDVFANLYRHPKRQGQPDTTFRSEHDVYALGVVLIEIGCWRTVDRIFKDVIEKGYMPKNKVEVWWRKEGRIVVKRELGEGFAEVIDWCLVAGPKNTVAAQHGALTAGWLAFRKSVVDVLAQGLDL
jgi:hypothetical protein